MNKGGFEFSFGWLFALIVGAVILFLAIYAAVKLVSTERSVQDTEIAKQLETILTPIETGTETGKSVEPIVFPSLTRVYNNCTTEGTFGKQKIAIATSSGIGKKWQEPGFEITSYNKYIFSNPVIEGKEVYVFSKPFSMPFKIANILYMWSNKYCFAGMNIPIKIENDINDLELKNINLTDKPIHCPKNSIRVCFDESPNCNISVDYDNNYLTKNGKSLYFYEDALFYGAIFSEPEIYECQVKRLMKRASELSLLYNAKSKIISTKSSDGCGSNLQADLDNFADRAIGITSSAGLSGFEIIAEELGNKNNKMTNCKLWEDD